MGLSKSRQYSVIFKMNGYLVAIQQLKKAEEPLLVIREKMRVSLLELKYQSLK
jgi:hypothetical protein